MGSRKNKKRTQKKHSTNAKATGDKKVLQGKLDITRSGMGFVIVEGMKDDIMIRPGNFNTGLHGDTVLVAVLPPNYRSSSDRTYGEIVKVVQRKQTLFMGTIHIDKYHGSFEPDGDKPIPDFFVPHEALMGAENGQRVVCRLEKWDIGSRRPEGSIVEILENLSDGAQAMKQIIYERGFALEFSDEAMEQALRIPDIISEKEIAKRKDFRKTFTITIDPVDARDFDDAISLLKIDNGLYEIGVHIADVSHYVTPGTILDDEAYERATSVYLPDRVNPMLPERISNELCSLRPKEDKLTFSAVFKITDKGIIKDTWIGRTAIHSNHRFTYEEVQEIIEGGEHEYQKEVLLLNKIAKIFRVKRFAKGAINFSSIETRFKLDETGKPIEVILKESKESHQLIEELMLLANKAVAEKVSAIVIKNKPIPFPYRVHDTPDEDKLVQFSAFARKFGHKFDVHSPKGISESFNAMLEAAQGKPEQHVLEQLGIRTMAKAIYTTDNIGHYGLGFENYCHFTSPIRRYPDVMVHRIMQQIIDSNVVIDKKMEEACKHCSERERAAMEAERAANKYKQVEFMQDYIGHSFEGVISGVASFGFWVETVQHKCEGLVSVSDLLFEDDYRFEQADYCLVGLRKGKKYRIGDSIQIKVIAANLEKRVLDYALDNGLADVHSNTQPAEDKVLQKFAKAAKASAIPAKNSSKKTTDRQPAKKAASAPNAKKAMPKKKK
jgi:ribonuclease R